MALYMKSLIKLIMSKIKILFYILYIFTRSFEEVLKKFWRCYYKKEYIPEKNIV